LYRADLPPSVTEQTTEGEYRVLESTREREEWLLLDVESADPTYVTREGYDPPLASTVESLDPGNRVRAALVWEDGDPRFDALDVLEETRFAFTRTREDLFGDAYGAWRDAEEAGQPMGSRVLIGKAGEPVGVVYTFAEQPGQRDLFEEFRDGVKPLEPLLERLAEAEDPPFAAFVLDHHDEPFVAVTLAFETDGMLATTVRETYFGASLFDSGALDVDVVGGSEAAFEFDAPDGHGEDDHQHDHE
jgi:hypothetical protein